jgi:hypothetical protein
MTQEGQCNYPDQDARATAETRQEQAFNQRLPDEPGPSGAQSRA